MSHAPRLPAELELKIFGFLDLVGLIKASCTCNRWRTLLRQGGAINLPERLALLRLYQDTISSPNFSTRRESAHEPLLPEAVAFDRAGYISRVSKLFPNVNLPLDFTLWVKEWPARAPCDDLWPGPTRGGMMMRLSQNEYCHLNPKAVDNAKTEVMDYNGKCTPGLVIRTSGNTHVEILVVGGSEKGEHDGAVAFIDVVSNPFEVIRDFSRRSWVQYLRRSLDGSA